jgi:hypothetical protein
METDIKTSAVNLSPELRMQNLHMVQKFSKMLIDQAQAVYKLRGQELNYSILEEKSSSAFGFRGIRG